MKRKGELHFCGGLMCVAGLLRCVPSVAYVARIHGCVSAHLNCDELCVSIINYWCIQHRGEIISCTDCFMNLQNVWISKYDKWTQDWAVLPSLDTAPAELERRVKTDRNINCPQAWLWTEEAFSHVGLFNFIVFHSNWMQQWLKINLYLLKIQQSKPNTPNSSWLSTNHRGQLFQITEYIS